jgi:hypothetical protein
MTHNAQVLSCSDIRRKRDDIVKKQAKPFRLNVDVRCGDCCGEGSIGIDDTRPGDWSPREQQIECESCGGSGCIPEPPDAFVRRVVAAMPADQPNVIAIDAMIALANHLDAFEEFETPAKQSLAIALGIRVLSGTNRPDIYGAR